MTRSWMVDVYLRNDLPYPTQWLVFSSELRGLSRLLNCDKWTDAFEGPAGDALTIMTEISEYDLVIALYYSFQPRLAEMSQC